MNTALDDSFHVFDTTLRDGAQSEGINLTVNDKLALTRLLDDFGVGFIEGGWPGANPRDTEFFRRAKEEIRLRHATLVAFGSTRRPGVRVEEDAQVAALLDAGTDTVHLVAKSHDRHVELALRTGLEENLRMVSDTVAHVRAHGRRVFLACEHFFDGYVDNPEYALDVVRTAHEAGAEVVVLCDTNGGWLPSRIHAVVAEVHEATGARLGVHTQDDTGCAVANTLAAVEAGATHVQCTANGYGERVGNANLFQVVAALELKHGRKVLPEGGLARMTRLAHEIAEIVDMAPPTHEPYVGASAFAHKGGLHASAVKVDPGLYQHIDPALVGNGTRMLVSDLGGRASLELKAEELGISLHGDRELSARLIARVKERELHGYAYESADASLELLIREEVGAGLPRPFEVEYWRIVSERRVGGRPVHETVVELRSGARQVVAEAKAPSPEAGLHMAVQRGLGQMYPDLGELRLVDFKARTFDTGGGRVCRVLLTMASDTKRWTTVGVDEDPVTATWGALDDAYVHGLLHSGVVRLEETEAQAVS